MAAHGWQKLTEMTPSGFGEGMLDGLGVPAPVLFGWIVALVELVGGALLAGLLVVALLGPGKPSLDHVLGIERGTPTTSDHDLTRA